ncbi:MAG: amylo-alpha-1,6-glucosidase [Chthonomonadales bacterium]
MPDPWDRLNITGSILQDFEAASRREWLAVNHIGGYASGTLCGANTRRYHGLLVAAMDPPRKRRVALSKLEEAVTAAGNRVEISCNQYPGAVHPQGYRFLQSFSPWPWPTFQYELPQSGRLVKSVWMAPGRNATYIQYEWRGRCAEALLEITPLVCWKDYHTEMQARAGFPLDVRAVPGRASIELAEEVWLDLVLPGAQWQPMGTWYYHFEHLRELERGFDWHEDLYAPGRFRVLLREGEPVILSAGLNTEAGDPHEARRAVSARFRGAQGEGRPFTRALFAAADAFAITPNGGAPHTIVAGYPWFADWGRDTMISLPGLLLSRGDVSQAQEILRTYAAYVSQGMIPNRFPESGADPEYNTADATLWYVNAIWQTARAGASASFVREMWPVVKEIIRWHVKGTRWSIGVDASDGLLRAGDASTQLTWMDARVDGRPVTPRAGKAVEICALWYNALRIAEDMAKVLGEPSADYARGARAAARSFNETFVRSDGRGLFDVVTDTGPDAAIRPNQLFAASLPFAVLRRRYWASMLHTIEQELATEVGLRTLSPRDPGYRGRYQGTPAERDSAYHQGTVWPWLLGPYLQARRRAFRGKAAEDTLLDALLGRLLEYGVGYLPELYDGDAPHAPGGCIAQAWSVATLLEYLVPPQSAAAREGG